MIQYIYFVKCPDCEGEHFDFFDDAKCYALGCLSKKPVITQVEVCRNDFGECTDSTDLGAIWSWEDETCVAEEPAVSVFTQGDLAAYNPDNDTEFAALDNSLDFVPDNFRKPVPDGMTVDQLVEEMEENEDTVECKWCEELFDKSECRYEVDLGWLCSRCEAAIKSRGETLTFRENSYWDFLYEGITPDELLADCVESSDFEIWGLKQAGNAIYNAVLLKRYKDVSLRDPGTVQEIYDEMLNTDGAFTFSFGKNGAPILNSWNSELFRKLGPCEIIFADVRYEEALNALSAVAKKHTLDESAKVTTWICFFEDKEVGRVEASTEEEALEKMQEEYPEYHYGMYDCFYVEPVSKELEESFLERDPVEFVYDDMTVNIVTRVIPATREDPEDYEEDTVTDSFTFEVDANDVATTIWENFITEEDAVDVPGGLDALEDDATWKTFLTTHFDTLFKKYYKQLLGYYEEAATEAASKEWQQKFVDLEPDEDRAYDEWRDSQLFDESAQKRSVLEELEDADSYRGRLDMCPECGESNSFDPETLICINCGFN